MRNEYETQNIDHLGIVAGISREIGLVETIKNPSNTLHETQDILALVGVLMLVVALVLEVIIKRRPVPATVVETSQQLPPN